MPTSSRVMLRCVGCKEQRVITPVKFAKGKPFCPRCGNLEMVVKAKQGDEKTGRD
jgi:rRNA maturation endonuclease Nob1